MKKLIISMVATASIALVAKADGALRNATSFENLDVGPITEANQLRDEDDNIYWTGYSADSDLVVKELGVEGGLHAKPEGLARPLTGDDAKALAIDVDTPLARNIATAKGKGVPQNIGTGLYFDSMVQFTATDTPPDVTPGDKLIVWLREEVTSEEEGGSSTYKLCVTAAKLDVEAKPTANVFVSDKAIEPDSWHRLTIAMSSEQFGDVTGLMVTKFRVYVDSEPVLDGVDLYSLVSYQETDHNPNKITSVSFQGKGAIDDLVWTDEDPYAIDAVVLTVNVKDDAKVSTWKWSYSNFEEAMVRGENSLTVPASVNSIMISCTLENGYNLTAAGFTSGENDGDYTLWTKEIVIGETKTFEFVVEEDEEVIANFTVGDKSFATFTDAIAEVAQKGGTITIASDATDESLALSETIKITADTTIDFNGMTLTSTADLAVMVTAGTLSLTGEGGITAPWVVIQQGTQNGGETTTVNVGEKVMLISKNDLPKTGKNGFGDNVVYLCGKATLNVAGTLKTDSDYYCAIQTSGNDTLADVAITINGTVINNNEVAIGFNLHKDANGSLVVNDGATITGKSGIYARSGTVTINGGTITATGKLGDASTEAGGTATGNALVVHKDSDYAALTVAVDGGDFNGYNGAAAIASVGEEITGFVTGGTFNTEIDSAFLAEGKALKKDGENWTVAQTYTVSATAENATVTLKNSVYFEGDTVTFEVAADKGYEVKSVTADKATVSATANAGEYTFTMPAEAVTIVVTTEAEYPEVDAEEGETVTEFFSDDAKAVIKDAFTVNGVYVKPSAPLAVEVNGEALKGNAAVEMINEVVEKFSGNPFTNGKLELTFKVTDVMEALKGDAKGYNLKVGRAQLRDTYQVVPKYIDLATKAESPKKPTEGEGAVIFKLSIEPVAAE